MLILLNVLVFIFVVLLILGVYLLIYGGRQEVGQRLEEIKKIKGEDEEPEEEDILAKPFSERMLNPFLRKMGSKVASLTPGGYRSYIEKKITYAGKQNSFSFSRFVTIQLLLAVFFFVLFSFLLSLLPDVTPGSVLVIALFVGFIGFYMPTLAFSSLAKKRQTIIQKSLPDFLDLLLVSVDAGLGFDMALNRVSNKMEGPLSQEMLKALEEVRMGKSREEALRGIVYRTGVPDLGSFISAVIQAEQLGANIASTLRVQANTMRQKRRQRAEKAAMQAPVKMLFPIAFFIFPVLFVVILAPALIQIVNVLFTM